MTETVEADPGPDSPNGVLAATLTGFILLTLGMYLLYQNLLREAMLAFGMLLILTLGYLYIKYE